MSKIQFIKPNRLRFIDYILLTGVVEWILEFGIWNDSGAWIDTSLWID